MEYEYHTERFIRYGGYMKGHPAKEGVGYPMIYNPNTKSFFEIIVEGI